MDRRPARDRGATRSHALIRRVRASWAALERADAPAWPLDAFRIFAGLVIAGYFLDLLATRVDLTGPDGLFDHLLGERLRPWSFHGGFGWRTELPWVAGWSFGVAGGLCIALGILPRVAAAATFPVAVSGYHWNFAISYVDDYFVNILLMWLVVLPVGSTLSVLRPIREGDPWTRRVPDLPIRLFLLNVALVYVVAGSWKLTSPIWRAGEALWVIEQMPAGRFAHAFRDAWRPWLVPLGYGALVLEPLIPVLLWLRRPRWAPWLGLAAQVGLHIGIAATIRVPFVNVALLATPLLFFRHELGAWQRSRSRSVGGPPAPLAAPPAPILTRCAALYLALVFLSAMPPLPGSRWARVALGRGLQSIGLDQSYRLFDWVDERPYRRALRIEAVGGEPLALDPGALLPDHLRAEILLTYLDGHPWKRFAPAREHELRASIRDRLAERICPVAPGASVTLWADMTYFAADGSQSTVTRPLLLRLCPAASAPTTRQSR